MKFLLVFSLLLGVASNKFISANIDIYQSIQEDLRNLNATCPDYDNCVEVRESDSLRSSSCHCSQFCTRLNTCCSDSPYNYVKRSKVLHTCRSISDLKAYFMVDRCPERDSKDSVWESLCPDEWNGEDDAMKLVPVTSLFTHITYKNYFCFRCHEAGDDFLYWKVNLGSSDYEFDETIDKDAISLNYDQTYRTWVAPLGKGGVLIPVNMTIDVPYEIYRLPIFCKPNVISQCSEEWTDKDVRDKCEAYMGLVYKMMDFKVIAYKNVHCALCNFEDLEIIGCEYFSAFGAKVPFSFTHLLDVNRSDGDEVGKVRRCQNEFLWDPYAKKCRKLACALPGYVIRNGKCTLP